MSRHPRLLIITLGGTISTAPDRRGYAVPKYGADDLLSTLPGVEEIGEITARNSGQKSSRAMTLTDMNFLAHEIDASVRSGYDGIVVTHGTDTVEETAYALSVQLALPVPIAITGAMRRPQEPGADGPANLLAALRVAATPAAADLGPVVVMHDEIHLARWVAKTHTSRIAAFSSPGFGPAGYVAEGKVHLLVQSSRQDYLGLPEQIEGRVELIWTSAGMDGLLVEAATSAAQGLVIAGTGGGHVPPAVAESLDRAVKAGLPVVLASRTGSGPILESTYGGFGSETHLLSIGVYPAGSLSPLKARIRLLVALALGKTASEVFPA